MKKLFHTCKQPTAQELAAADAFKKKQQALYDANVAKANPQPRSQPTPQVAAAGRPTPPKNAEERAMRRCVSSGRLPATCTGNSLLGAFSQMVGKVLPSAAKERGPGPELAGVFEGAGRWRLDFIDGGVLVNCGDLAPNQENYRIEFRNNRAVLTIDTRPKPLVLTVKGDGTMTAPGPVVIDGVLATGYDSGYRDQNGRSISANEAATSTGPVFDPGGRRLNSSERASGAIPGHATFTPKRTTCPALNLSSKGAAVGVQTMQTDLLKSLFSDGEKGPKTPPGIRMRGIFAAPSTGFSAQFFPESVILGCGPDAARAYRYTVIADGARAVIQVDAADHPLALALRPDGSLDAGTGPYQVHGRVVVGQNENDDFTFAPMEATCNLAVLMPSKEIPSTGGANAGAGATALSVPGATSGNAILTIVSGFPAQLGSPNPLAGRPYVLLRDSYANVVAKAGVSVPAGVSPYKYVGRACTARTPDCQRIMDVVKAEAASAVRADATGSGTFPGVAPGSYYLMISARVNNQALAWGQAVELKAGGNSVRLELSNAVRIE